VIEIVQQEVQSVAKVLFLSFEKTIAGASMRSYRLGYFPGLLAQSANYFLVCLLAWVSIPAAHAEDTACEATGATRIWVSPLNPKIDEPVKIMVVSTDGPASELGVLINKRL